MSSTSRYRTSYGSTTGSYYEQGTLQDAQEAHQEARRAAFRRARRDYRIAVGVFAAIVLAFCFLAMAAALGWAAGSVLAGAGR